MIQKRGQDGVNPSHADSGVKFWGALSCISKDLVDGLPGDGKDVVLEVTVAYC